MLWPFWTDAVVRALAVGPAGLGYVLLALGITAQLMGVRLLSTPRNRPAPTETALVSVPREDERNPLSFDLPLKGAVVPNDPDLLPGAGRGYRGGRHEGVDFRCAPGTQVKAAADGFVLSIDDEPNLPKQRREQLLAYCQRRHATPAEILKVLHGRRVVLCHLTARSELVTTSYSHLQRIDPTLKPGTEVLRDQVIGWVGSSGTSHAYGDSRWGELHFELRINGEPLGVGVSPGEAAALYRRYLGERP